MGTRSGLRGRPAGDRGRPRDSAASRPVPAPRSGPGRSPELVWYASYGSNMRSARLAAYLAGGRAPGRRHVHPGCRDPRPPRLSVPIMMPGGVYFALESRIWTGGMAFYDPDLSGAAPGRAHLLTAGQFADVAAQEMRRAPGPDLDLAAVLQHGRSRLGPGRYETIVLVGHRAGVPVLTFTAPWRAADVTPTAPSAAYLSMLAAGLREAHGWSPARIAGYLAGRPGAAGIWSAADLARLLDDPGHDDPGHDDPGHDGSDHDGSGHDGSAVGSSP